MLVARPQCKKIMQAIYDAGGMKGPGNGICFAWPVETVMGLESQLSILEEEVEKEL